MIDPKLAAALVKARSNITNPERDKKGVFAGHKYAALENVLDEVQPHLQAEGIVLMQDIQSVGGGIRAVNLFIHETGAVLKTKGPLILLTDKKPGTAGGAATYAKRYALLAALGIEADADQDVAKLQGKNPDQPAPKDAPGVNESDLDELAIKRQYSEQINRLNASAKAKDLELFVSEWVRIPMQDRVGVHGACLSQVRTFEKTKEVREAIAEADASFGQQEEMI
ncbi:MAG: ERF family protein [Luminiphilus sp.]|nr:ERF family protein [Luminiphilus sp.]